MGRVILVLLMFGFGHTNAQIGVSQATSMMYIDTSKTVNDQYEIYISLPKPYQPAKKYKVVYYLDANLKSGKALRALLSDSAYLQKRNQYIFVGIGHIGNYHALRRRDFIPSTSGMTEHKLYGKAAQFYHYLKEELIPFIANKYNVYTDSNSIVGHSLGGLFVCYSLFRSDRLFANYFALSPSLWVDHYRIYRFNQLDNDTARKYCYFAVGSKERWNKILKGTNELKVFLDRKAYTNLAYDYEVQPGKTHNSEVPVSLLKIINEKL